jgi:hypothetical protein
MPEHPYNSGIGQTDLMRAAVKGDSEEIARILTMEHPGFVSVQQEQENVAQDRCSCVAGHCHIDRLQSDPDFIGCATSAHLATQIEPADHNSVKMILTGPIYNYCFYRSSAYNSVLLWTY